MTIFQELKRRNLIAQATHEQEIEDLLNKGPQTFYIGFDATADSLHVGHFMQLVIVRRMIEAGHQPILLLGTGTTMVGDPSGKTDMRRMMTVEEINYNADCFIKQMARVVDIDKCIIERNGDWLLKLGYIEVLREVGVHFSVNKMLTAEAFKSRLAGGLSFIEFNYMIMQSYDFVQLYRKHNCRLQFGGNDQWSNIISGVDLVRRMDQESVYGLTFNLLETKDGQKMGKTVGGAVWLDAEKTSPYEFFQYWRNVDDLEVIPSLKMLTFLPIEEIEAMEKWEGVELNKAKEILAYELTKDVHGKSEATKALDTSRAIFSGEGFSSDMPSTTIDKGSLTDDKINILDLLTLTGLCASKSQARRMIQQNGISIDINEEGFKQVADIELAVTKEQLQKDSVVLKSGKKVFHKVNI